VNEFDLYTWKWKESACKPRYNSEISICAIAQATRSIHGDFIDSLVIADAEFSRIPPWKSICKVFLLEQAQPADARSGFVPRLLPL
jgi:hypothetical protein